jgi:hypothetical protein
MKTLSTVNIGLSGTGVAIRRKKSKLRGESCREWRCNGEIQMQNRPWSDGLCLKSSVMNGANSQLDGGRDSQILNTCLVFHDAALFSFVDYCHSAAYVDDADSPDAVLPYNNFRSICDMRKNS